MNEFTKKELQYLRELVRMTYLCNEGLSPAEDLQLQDKIQFMLENHCEHELYMNGKLKVIKCNHLSKCIPDQWELQLEDGRQLYLRARWDWLSAQISDYPSNDNDDAVSGKEIFCVPYDNYADKCGHAEIRYITRYYLDWSLCDEDTCQVNECHDHPKEKVE